MKSFCVGVCVGLATAGIGMAQSWGIGEDSPFAREGRDWQMIWQQQQ